MLLHASPLHLQICEQGMLDLRQPQPPVCCVSTSYGIYKQYIILEMSNTFLDSVTRFLWGFTVARIDLIYSTFWRWSSYKHHHHHHFWHCCGWSCIPIKNHNCTIPILSDNIPHIWLTNVCIDSWRGPHNTVEKVTWINYINWMLRYKSWSGWNKRQKLLMQLLGSSKGKGKGAGE